MPSRILTTVFDCRDAESLAGFWCAVLDYTIAKRWRDAHGVEYVEASRPGGHRLLFQPVAEHQAGRNGLHLDVRAEGSQYDEVARLVALGARLVADDPDQPWVVLQDPEGNEFCVLPSETPD